MNKRNLSVIPLLLLMFACAGTKHAYDAADGIEESAKVINEHFFALVREANALAESGDLTGSDLSRAQTAVSQARPVISSLSEAAQAYEATRSATNEIQLNDAINRAAIAVSKLIDTLKAVGGSSNLIESMDLKSMYVVEVAS